MANFDTGADILSNVIRRAGEILPTDTQTGSADHLIDAKLYVQRAYWDLCALKPWRWARKRKQFASVGEQTASVIDITTNTVTLGGVMTTDLTGYKFVLDSDGVPHRIQAHTAGEATFTLETSYTGSDATGAATIFQDEVFVASDILSFPRIKELHWGDDLNLVTEEILEQEYPRNVRSAPRALYAAFITDTTIRVCPWTTDARLFECSYNYRPPVLTFDMSASDVPVVPEDSRIAIAQRALMLLYADKRDARFQSVAGEFKETLDIMSTKETTFAKPQIYIPRRARV